MWKSIADDLVQKTTEARQVILMHLMLVLLISYLSFVPPLKQRYLCSLQEAPRSLSEMAWCIIAVKVHHTARAVLA